MCHYRCPKADILHSRYKWLSLHVVVFLLCCVASHTYSPWLWACTSTAVTCCRLEAALQQSHEPLLAAQQQAEIAESQSKAVSKALQAAEQEVSDLRTVAEALQQQLIASQGALKLAQAEHTQSAASREQAELERLQQRIEQLSQQLERAEEAHMRVLAEGRATSDDLSSRLSQSDGRAQQLQDQADQLSARLQAAQTDAEQLQETAQQTHSDKQELSQELQQAQSELGALTALLEQSLAEKSAAELRSASNADDHLSTQAWPHLQCPCISEQGATGYNLLHQMSKMLMIPAAT